MIDQLRPALLTMFVHDISDSFLFLGRILNDLRVNTKILVYSTYACIIVSWIIFRLYIFPVSVIYPVLRYSYSNLLVPDTFVRNGS